MTHHPSEVTVRPTIAIIGAGARGAAYARLATHAGAAVVAVAEPDPRRRADLASELGLGSAAAHADWESLLGQPRLADAVVIATPDRDHVGPAVAAARRGYDILLEKPMAPTEAEAQSIVAAVEAAGVSLTVCHVLRYTRYTRAIVELLASGAIGDVVSVEHLEPIGWWHFAHSYVRGQWAREAESSSMLLAKSSHDIDWIAHVVDQPVTRVSSFGSLFEFRPERKPVAAEGATRCFACPIKDECAYSATTIYRRFLGDPVHERWPLGVLTHDVSPQSVSEALRTGPYGRCVYDGYNDVVDHQVVNIEFASGATASFTVAAFTDLDFRQTRIFGTAGCLEGDGRAIHLHDFRTDTKSVVDTSTEGSASAADGHGGADAAMVNAWVAALTDGDSAPLSSGARASLASHQVVWAAERSRRSGSVVTLDGPRSPLRT